MTPRLFLNSVEYVTSKGGYGRGLIVGMYEDLLSRTPAEDEVQLWLRTLEVPTVAPVGPGGAVLPATSRGSRR
jgi:hypothetical protein